MINSIFEEKAEKLLLDADCFSIPVDLEKLAENLEVKIQGLTLEADVSGFFVMKNNIGNIGYNISDGPLRRRFTIAHELGHYILHAKETPLFVDKVDQKLFRNSTSSTGEIIKEREANAFAASLLMPRKLLLAEVEKLGNGHNRSIIPRLASIFFKSARNQWVYG